MGHYCGFGPSVGQYGTSGYTSNFPWFIGTNGTSKNWDYGGWHNSTSRSCHQQVDATVISPGSGYDHVQRPYTNDFTASDGRDNSYWNIHTYQTPDHIQETCSTDSTRSDGSDDCYWSVHTFPVSGTKPHVTQTQPRFPEGTVDDSMVVPQTTEYHEMKEHKLLNPVPEVQIVECVPLEQQSQLYEKNENSTTHDNVWEQMKEEIAEGWTKSKQNEQEAQKKRAEEELHTELRHFLYHAFDLFEEEHVGGADIVALDADYVLSSLKEVISNGKLSLCHFSFGKWINQISKEQEQIFVKGITDLPLLQAATMGVAETLMFRAEKVRNPHWDFRDNPLNDLKLPNTTEEQSKFASIQWGILSTEERKICSVHVQFLKLFASGDLFPFIQECTIDAKLIIQGDPGVENNREIACISLLHPVTTDVRMILPWDPGNFRSEIKTEWLPLQSGTTNVNLLFPWDPGEQGFIHVQNMEITFFHLASTNSYVMQWKFTCHEEFKRASSFQDYDFSLVFSSYVIMMQPVLKSETELQLLQLDDLMVDTFSLCSKAKANLLCTSWGGEFPYVAPAIIGIWRGLEKLMPWTQHSFVIYLHTCTLSPVEVVPCLLVALFCSGVQVVFIVFSSIILQVLQTTYISLLDMNA